MKLSAVLLAVVAAQDDDRWSFYDYSIPDGKTGHSVSGTGTAGRGGHEGNRRFCHSTVDTVHIHRWDVTRNGYFAHFNPVECVGEEMFCSIEERAHFGQIIGIRAGCAQMMNHPQVATKITATAEPELKNHYNQEAMRGNEFSQGGIQAVSIFYGVGGCLALPAQNGWDVHASDFRDSMENNYFMGTSGGYGQNQCLRFQQGTARANLLPFGVSVCRTCCLATIDYFDSGNGPCNFYPYGAGDMPDNALSSANFACTTAAGGSCTFDGSTGVASDCDICHKEMYPNFSMYTAPDFGTSVNVFEIDQNGSPNPFCNGSTCSPAVAYGGSQQIVG